MGEQKDIHCGLNTKVEVVGDEAVYIQDREGSPIPS